LANGGGREVRGERSGGQEQVEQGLSLFVKFGQGLQKIQMALFGDFNREAQELQQDEEHSSKS